MFEELKKILVEELQIAEEIITPEAELKNDLDLNSLELADLVMVCEEKFNTEIDEDEIKKFITVQDIVDYLESK